MFILNTGWSQGQKVFNSPLQNSFYVFSKEYSKSGTLKKKLLHENLPEDIKVALTPRDNTQFENFAVPHTFPIPMVIYGTFYSITGEMAFKTVTICAGVFTLISLEKLIRRFFPKVRRTLYIYVVVGLFPIYLIFSSEFLRPDLLVFLFSILFLNFLLRFLDSNQIIYWLFLVFFSSFTVVLKYDYVIALFIILLIVFLPKISSIISIRRIIGAVLILAFITIPVLLINQDLYGNYFQTGYQLSNEMRRMTALNPDNAGTDIINTEFDLHTALIQLFYIFIYGHRIFYAIIFLFSTMILLKERNGDFLSGLMKYKGVVIGILTSFSILVYMNISRKTYGYNFYTITPSFLRYVLPLYLVLLGASITILLNSLFSKYLKISFVFVILLTNIIFTIKVVGGAEQRKQIIEKAHYDREFLIDNTQEDDLLVLLFSDKILFPKRHSLVVAYLSEPGFVNDLEDRFFYRYPTKSLLVDKIKRVLNEDIDVYLYETRKFDFRGKLFGDLINEDVNIEKVCTLRGECVLKLGN